MTILIILLCLLISQSALLSASETALFSLSSMTVKSYKQSHDPRKKLVAQLLANPRDLLVTIIMLNVIANILVQNVVSSIFSESSGWLLSVGVPLALTLIFGEVIPKSIALSSNTKIAPRVAPVLKWAQKIMYPIRKLLTGTTFFISRSVFFFLRREKEISIDELQHALKTSREHGVLNEDEAQLIHRYLNLQESNVKELMRPREEVIFFDVTDPLSKLIHMFVDEEVSRVPVCNESLDNVIGIMTSKLFFLHKEQLQETGDLIPILEKPFFVPESMDAEDLIRQMYDKDESLAVVVDEYGSVSGIITLEDLVETVVGEIADRRDQKSLYTRSGEDVIIASGKLELMDFEDIFGIPLESKSNMVTIGGWLTEVLGDIPKSGTKYVTKDFLFHVLAADPTRVRRVYIRRLKRKKP